MKPASRQFAESSKENWVEVAATSAQPSLIFISIASYRDPQLVPTVQDCLKNARRPERLRFGICWQHADDQELPDWFCGDQFRVLDVDYRDSGGACWARAKIMELWDGEEWFLQLDSHLRFAVDWDSILLEEVALTNSDRPIMTTYGPAFSPSEPEAAEQLPMSMQFDSFNSAGVPVFRPRPIPDWEQRTRPRCARFAAGGLFFAPGRFVRDVPYDPDLYFTGEEITLAARAYTHGYDLFEPSRVIVWHEYSRADLPKHWDDHQGEGGPAWYDRETVSRAKIHQLFNEQNIGHFGLGTERTLEEYQAYAGISFQYRKVQDYTRQNRRPPNPPANLDWPLHVGNHHVEIAVDMRQLSREALDHASSWHVAVHDIEGRNLYQGQIPRERELADGQPLTLTIEFESQARPCAWTVIPFAEGWLQPLTGPVSDHECVGLGTNHPARVPGIMWESASESHLPLRPGDAGPRCKLNSSGALVVELADGRQSVRDIATCLMLLYQLADDPVNEVLEFCETAYAAGLITKEYQNEESGDVGKFGEHESSHGTFLERLTATSFSVPTLEMLGPGKG